MSKIELRLKELGVTLPAAAKPVATYVPAKMVLQTSWWRYLVRRESMHAPLFHLTNYLLIPQLK